MRIRKTRAVAAVIFAALMIQLLPVASLAAASISDDTTSSVFVPIYIEGSYGEYLQNYAREKTPTNKFDIDILSYESSDDVKVMSLGGRDNVVVTGESGQISYTFNVPSSGLYAIGLNYYTMAGKGAAIERRILVNGKVLYSEANTASLDRAFTDDVDDPSDIEHYFTTDTSGNQIRPAQKEIEAWYDEQYFKDAAGVYGALRFYLEKGENTITFVSVREPLAFSALWICGYEDTQSYDDLLVNNAEFDTSGTSLITTVQAEMPYAKSKSSLVAGTDKASSATYPASTGVTKLNILGSLFGTATWKTTGEWVEYKVNVPKDGLYKIVLRARQSFKSGIFASREITVNGEKPYEGYESTKFSYNSSWQYVTPSDEYGDPLLYKFHAGENTIRIRVVYGDLFEIINAVSAVIDKLNADYRKILMLIGYDPDTYRDYELDTEIPEVISDLKAQADVLKKIYKEINSVTGEIGEITAQLETLYQSLYTMYEDPDKIPSMFASLSDNIGTLGQWQADISEQPIELDSISVAEKNYDPGNPENGFFADFGHQVKMFFASFFTDVNAIASTDASSFTEKVKVWMTTSRDEAQIVRQLIDRKFVKQNQMYVELDLVNGGALMPSILAGVGPDVVLGSGGGVDWSARGAFYPLDTFEDFDEVAKRFLPIAFETYTIDWGDERGTHIYGLPESESFEVVFYRTDVFEDLGVDVPKTWDEVYDLIALMQKRYMDFVPPSYELILYQNGGHYYRNHGTYTDIDSAVGIDSFIEWTDFYVAYKCPITSNFQNRFRFGEMPIGIQGLGFYGTISIFAPEINGLWTIAEVPGKVREDGTVNNNVVYATSGCGMLSGAKNVENAWTFMKWWTDTDAQVSYGKEIESLLGIAGRYYTANTEALKQMNWTADELEVILAQRDRTVSIRPMVGSYLLSRYITMSFNSVVVDDQEPRETLLDYIKEINDEMVSKRNELGIKVFRDEDMTDPEAGKY